MSRGDFQRLTVDDRSMKDDEAQAARLRFGLLLAGGERVASCFF